MAAPVPVAPSAASPVRAQPSAPEPPSLENELPGEAAPQTPHDQFRRAVDALRGENARLGKSFSFARFVSLEPGLLKVAFPPDAGFHRATVFGSGKVTIEEALSRHFGRATKVQEDTSSGALSVAPKSIAEQEASARTAREQRIDSSVRTHPSVVNVLRILGGQLEHVHVLEPESAAAPEADEPVEPVEPD